MNYWIKTDDKSPYASMLHGKLKSNSELVTIQLGLRRRQVLRLPRDTKDIKRRDSEYSKTANLVYKKFCYFERGSDAGDGGGALPLSQRTALLLAQMFLDIYLKMGQEEKLVILLVGIHYITFLG